MISLIVGRSGRGKTTLAEELEKLGLKVLKTYTTRKPRSKDDDSHIFITRKQADMMKNRITETEINGNLYFFTKEMIENEKPDVIVIDPVGLYELIKNMPDTSFHIIDLRADEIESKKHAIERSQDPKEESIIYEARAKDENKMFSDFEKIAGKEPIADNAICVYEIMNDFNPRTLEDYATMIAYHKNEFDNLLKIINESIDLNIVNHTDSGKIKMWFNKKESQDLIYKELSKEIFADTLLSCDEGFTKLMHSYLQSKNNTNN